MGRPPVGARVRIIACPVANLAGGVWLVEGDVVLDRWRLQAAGCSL